MRLYIIRHADPDYPNNTITCAGHAEARALAQRLANEGLTRLYSSPLGRARDTAVHTAEATGLEVGIEPWTAELGELRMSAGPLAGMMVWDAHGHLFRAQPRLAASDRWDRLPFIQQALAEPEARAADASDASGTASASSPSQEPMAPVGSNGDGRHGEKARSATDPGQVRDYRAVVERVAADSDAFLARHGYQREGGAYRVVQPNTERIAVFCHGGLGLTWLAHLLAIPVPLMWAAFWLAPSSVTTVLMDERVDGLATPRCLALGDTSHLHAAGLPIQPAGIKANFT